MVHLTAECWPYARTGGLGEAVSALASHQAASATPVTVMLPLYRCVREVLPSLESLGPEFTVAVGSRIERARLRTFHPTRLAPRMVFIDLPAFFDRDGVYGERGGDYGDNAVRYAFFCRAALRVLPRVAPTAAVVHAHDWHAALAPVYLRTLLAKRPFYRGLTAVMSLHNAAFQGRCPADTLPMLGLPWSLFDWRLLEWYGQVNLLKGGLAFSDAAVAVSPTHSWELCTPAGGFGLHDHFTGLGGRLTGVTNGIDVNTWDPAADPHLPAGYTVSHLEGKRRCKADLQAALGLSVRSETPLIALCARLTEQKGLDLVLEGGLPLDQDAQFAFLGEGEARYASALHRLSAMHPGRIAAVTAFSDALEHRLLGGADVVMMPSLYEPCGLTQLRAQRYGALPVARRVGGLADTIEDGISGFLFQEYRPAALRRALERALEAFASPAAWLRLVRAAMRREVGWGPPAQAYGTIYERAAEQRKAVGPPATGGEPGRRPRGRERTARA